MQVDFGRTADDYVKHRAGFPEPFFLRLEREGVLRSGLRAVDLGTGTGTVARGLARHGCQVTALDISAAMLESAQRLASAEGLSIDWRLAPVEDTGLPEGSAELVIAGQCWHWFERAAAAREASRLLRPGGRLDLAVPYTHEAWRGRVRASAKIGASLAPKQVARFDAALAVTLSERFPREPLAVPHRVFVLIATRP